MEALLSYVKTEKDSVSGWFSRIDSQIFYEILCYQNKSNIQGGVAEIGLHHGKSFIALCLGLVDGQKAYGIDIFENQSLNIDKSGQGERDKVESHLKSFGVKTSSFVLDSRSSEVVKADEIKNAVGDIRFFSIDGGHFREIVRNDFELAEKVLTNGGVIALDDFMRPEWPDVSIGFFDWYEYSSRSIVPFAIGYNKLYLCHKSKVFEMINTLESSMFLKHFLSKHYKFCGNEIPIFQTYPLPEWGMRTRIKEYLKLYYPDLYVKVRSLLLLLKNLMSLI